MRVENIKVPAPVDSFAFNSPALRPEVQDKSRNTSAELKPEQKSIPENDEHQIKVAIEQANKALEGVKRHFEYEVHQATKQVIISVVDDKTNEVIGEIPSKKLLDAIAKLWELAGLFVDERR